MIHTFSFVQIELKLNCSSAFPQNMYDCIVVCIPISYSKGPSLSENRTQATELLNQFSNTPCIVA